MLSSWSRPAILGDDSLSAYLSLSRSHRLLVLVSVVVDKAELVGEVLNRATSPERELIQRMCPIVEVTTARESTQENIERLFSILGFFLKSRTL